jgi:hypothetical protein
MLYNERGMYLVNCFWHCEAIYFTRFPVFQTYITLWLSNIINEVVKSHRLKHWNNSLKETMINERKKYDKFIPMFVIEWHWFSWSKDDCLILCWPLNFIHWVKLRHLFCFQKGHLLLIPYQVVQQYLTVTSLTFVKVIWINSYQYLSNISIYLLSQLVREVWCIDIDVGLSIWRSLVRYLTNNVIIFFNLLDRINLRSFDEQCQYIYLRIWISPFVKFQCVHTN